MDDLHREKINRVVDYIQDHLESNLSIQELSKVACLSSFHFNRIFKNLVGEPLYQFIKRLRLEKAAGLLCSSELPITEIALTCGFETSASFSKSFKKHFQTTPTGWRNRTKDNTPSTDLGRISIINHSPVWSYPHENSVREVRIENIPPCKVAYVRNIGPYQEDAVLFRELSNRLMEWAIPRGVVNEKTPMLNLYHDDPEVTESSNQRVMVAIPLIEAAEPSGSIGVTEFSGGTYAVCRFQLGDNEFKDAWQWICEIWLPSSGYEWDNRASFERCYGEKSHDNEVLYDVEIGIPIKVK